MNTLPNEDLEAVMHALTLADRPAKRTQWLKSGFHKIHARPGSLFAYWRARVDSDSASAALAAATHAQYLVHMEEIANGTAPTKGAAEVPPSLLTKAATLASAITSEAKAVLAGEPALAKADIDARLSVCHAPCDDFNESNNTCKRCGCYVPAKARFRSQNCPAGRWPITQTLNA